MTQKLTRRQVIKTVSSALILPVACTPLATDTGSTVLFNHGVASGDPDHSSVVIWTRVSPIDDSGVKSVNVDWFVSTDEAFSNIVNQGKFITKSDRDYTVKVIVNNLDAGQNYFYKFEATGAISPTGRTKTLPDGHLEQIVFAVASCSNYPFGYFNAYDDIANDPTIDMVVHLGDYIYEYDADSYGSHIGKRIGRNHQPVNELLTLDDYRIRHAQYKRDHGSVAMHKRHPLIVIWDDHETANDPWMGGAQNHQSTEGHWQARRAASLQAYFEWMPVRDPTTVEARPKYWRHYKFGDLVSLITLESRHTGRDKQINFDEYLPKIHNKKQAQEFMRTVVELPDRKMLSEEMESFLKSELEESVSSGRRWRVIGNQTVMARLVAPNLEDPLFTDQKNKLSLNHLSVLAKKIKLGKLGLPTDLDSWSGYPKALERFYKIAKNAGAEDLLVLSGDSHTFWQNELFNDKEQAVGVELGTAGISSIKSVMRLGADVMHRYDAVMSNNNKYVLWTEGRYPGYIRLNIKHDGAHADFVGISNIETRQYESDIIRSVDIIRQNGTLHYKEQNQ